MRWLSHSLDQARNLDVFAEAVLAPAARMDAPPAGLQALAEAVGAARDAARRAACETAASARFRALMIDAAAWAETGAWREGERAREPARAFAARVLDRRFRKLLKRGRKLDAHGDEARHELRIQAKKLRYAAEGFAPLFPRKKADRFTARLKALQDALGPLNDLATAEPLLAGLNLPPEAAYAAGELEGLRLARKPKLIAKAAKAMAKLSETEPFWG
jgi:CHAD domain-containing protein